MFHSVFLWKYKCTVTMGRSMVLYQDAKYTHHVIYLSQPWVHMERMEGYFPTSMILLHCSQQLKKNATSLHAHQEVNG